MVAGHAAYVEKVLAFVCTNVDMVPGVNTDHARLDEKTIRDVEAHDLAEDRLVRVLFHFINLGVCS